MEAKVLITKKSKQIKLRQHKNYNHLEDSQFIERLKSLIEKTNSTKDLDTRSATEILLEDRR